MDTPDGHILCVDNPEAFQEVSMGGVNQQSLAFAMNAKDMASYVMGNLDALAGLGQSAGTLGQEKIIKSSSSDRMRAMQTSMSDATQKVIQDIAFY